MKLVLAFVAGVAFTGLVLGLVGGAVFGADSDDEQDLSTLLPDISHIYRTSLASPFQKVEQEIYDEDIADFYRSLMQDTGLTTVSEP